MKLTSRYNVIRDPESPFRIRRFHVAHVPGKGESSVCLRNDISITTTNCLPPPPICGYNFPGFWIFAIHLANFTVVYLTSSIPSLSLSLSSSIITTILLHQSALSSPFHQTFLALFLVIRLNKVARLKGGKERVGKKISIASRGEKWPPTIWPPGDRPGNKPRRLFLDRQIITLERSPKGEEDFSWKEYIRS